VDLESQIFMLPFKYSQKYHWGLKLFQQELFIAWISSTTFKSSSKIDYKKKIIYNKVATNRHNVITHKKKFKMIN